MAKCTIQKGLAIGAQDDFADTFNWLVQFCSNLEGQDGIKVDKSDEDHPKIKYEPDEDEEDDGSGDGNGIIYHFDSRDDSNVQFDEFENEDGSVTVKVGVYYV